MALRAKLVCGLHELEIHALPNVMYPHAEQLNYVALDSATGERHVFNYGPTRVNASIIWQGVDYETAVGYEEFLMLWTKLGRYPFNIVCPEYIDFGMGKGVNICNAYYAGSPTTKDLITPRGEAGLYYDIELPYMFVRSW